MDDTVAQVNEQGAAQRDRLVELLRGVSRDLREMAERGDGSSLAGQLVRQSADRADRVSSSLDGREPSDLVDEVRGFARRKPGTFLLGALIAGVVAGRFARGSKDADSSPGSSSSPGPAHRQETPAPTPVTGPIQPAHGLEPGAPVADEVPTTSYSQTDPGATLGSSDRDLL